MHTQYSSAQVQHCDAETEVCCRLASASGGSSSKAGFTGLVGKGNLPANINDLVEVLTDQSPDGKLCHGGESGNTNKPVRDISVSGSSGNLFPTADYSNVQFDSNVRFASSIQGPAYLPPIELSPSTPTTSPSLCPAGTFLAPSGRCEGRKVETCPPGTTKRPDGTCEPRVPTCPPGTALTPFGSCEVPKKPAPVCPSGTVKLPDGSCATPNS
ncbi:hypothetical protein NQ318_002033 [Aromia moschata]|uniref:Uncharacterized protein n=1 Tax=Aromia moschata TaxID=1265417 RepID=A0AAV8Z406_9CUCU|nr:hypothetical protein NQ318_002033 [Aromia moschata]